MFPVAAGKKPTHRTMSVSFLLPQTAEKMLSLGLGLQRGGAATLRLLQKETLDEN